MAQSVLDLIDVKFQDATSHVSTTSTDTVGLVMPFYWGESDKMVVYNKTTFFEMFPESLPIGVKNIENTDLYSGYAQVKAAFAHGAGEVEIYRPSGGWKYQRLTISDAGVVVGNSGKLVKDNDKYDETKAVTVALKHAGFIPQALAYGYNYVHVGVALENNADYTDGAIIKLNVYGSGKENEYDAIATVDMYDAVSNPSGNPKTKGYYERSGEGTELSPYEYSKTDDTTVNNSKTYYVAKNPQALGWYARSGEGTSQSPYVYTLADVTEPASGVTYCVRNQFDLLESFEGAASATANIGGESIYLEDVVNGNSMFIDVRVASNVTIVSDVPETKFECNNYDETTVYTSNSFTEPFKLGIDKGFKYFRDYESSICTLIINPFVSNGAKYGDEVLKSTYDAEIKTIAEYRKNCLAVIGYPIDNSSTYDKTTIETYFNSHSSKGSKFCIVVQGQEYITVFGQRFTLNCIGGYCGAMVNIAKEAHLNQIASGYVYGNYGGSLKKSLLSGAVIDLMELGINSVYSSKRGNIIWGTRTRYGRQSSYFGKINVMRVTTMLLKNIFPIAIETLHTDAASNPITRSSLSTMLNSIIDTYKNNQDLLWDSKADCSDAINTDYLTKGGTVLNIILQLHFIGLVERVSIKIIATDTSVTAEFV